jgi:hypothetical protein
MSLVRAKVFEVMTRESTQGTPEKDLQHARMILDPQVNHRSYIIWEMGIFALRWYEGWYTNASYRLL